VRAIGGAGVARMVLSFAIVAGASYWAYETALKHHPGAQIALWQVREGKSDAVHVGVDNGTLSEPGLTLIVSGSDGYRDVVSLNLRPHESFSRVEQITLRQTIITTLIKDNLVIRQVRWYPAGPNWVKSVQP
jgi:hypothetical protein